MARSWSTVWVVRCGARLSVVMRRMNSLTREGTTTSRIGHMMVTRYQNDAIELWQLDLQTRKEVALTSRGDVNVEPRYSPDDRQVAFVSTADSGHFNLYAAKIADDRLTDLRRLLPEHTSNVYRYYYAPTDHAINPSWTPDGQHLLFVSNREVAYGTGDIWSVAVNAPEDLKKIFSEETAWRAQPQVPP